MRIIPISLAALLAACAGGSQAPATGGEPERVVQAFYDAFARRDIEGMLATYAPDAVFIEAPADTLMRGTGELRRFYKQQFQLFPRLRVEVRERRVQGRTVVDEIVTRDGICAEPSVGGRNLRSGGRAHPLPDGAALQGRGNDRFARSWRARRLSGDPRPLSRSTTYAPRRTAPPPMTAEK